MFRILFCLLWDSFFIYALIAFGDEAGGYIFLFIGLIALFTWELIQAIKAWLEK